jgi:hypothetical protein
LTDIKINRERKRRGSLCEASPIPVQKKRLLCNYILSEIQPFGNRFKFPL